MYVDGGYNYHYLIHPYIVVDGNVYISKNAACQLYWSGSGVPYNYHTNFGNDKFNFYSSGVKRPENLFGNIKPRSIDDEFFTRLWLDFSSGNMVVKLGENRAAFSSESKCYSALYTVTFDSSIDSSVSTGVDFKEATTSTGGTIWNYTVTGNVAISAGSDCFYNLTDSSDTISYSDIAAMQEQGTIIDSGYVMKTTALMTTNDNAYTVAVDNILNLPISLIEAAALTQAAEQGLTDDELNPTVSFTTDIDPTTGDVVNTDVTVGDDVISGSGAGEQDKDKDLVYVPSISQSITGSGELSTDLYTPAIIPTENYNLYEQCKKIINNIWGYDSELGTSLPPNFKFYYDSNGDGVSETYDVLNLSFLETTLTNENMADKSWFATPIKIIDLIRWLIAVVIYGLFAMRLIKRLPTFYGSGGGFLD